MRFTRLRNPPVTSWSCDPVWCVDGEEGGTHKQKTKRVRTSFTEDQLRVLHANFRIDSNPDGQDLERIAQQTGLSKRVTQVWFQNSRARQKKHQQTSSSSHSLNRNNNTNNAINNNTNSNNNNNNNMSTPPPSSHLTTTKMNMIGNLSCFPLNNNNITTNTPSFDRRSHSPSSLLTGSGNLVGTR